MTEYSTSRLLERFEAVRVINDRIIIIIIINNRLFISSRIRIHYVKHRLNCCMMIKKDSHIGEGMHSQHIDSKTSLFISVR